MKKLLLVSALALGLAHCGYPGKELSVIEKRADIEWVYGTFERNYAPAEWKNTKHGSSLAQMKEDCLKESESLTKGDEFIALLTRCVSRFQDAHTRIMPGGQVLPELITVAFLGFRTELIRFDRSAPPNMKKEDEKKHAVESPTQPVPATSPAPVIPQMGLKVSALLPTTQDPAFPVKIDDIIISIDGRNIRDYLTEEIVPYSNLGHEDSSLVIAGTMFALRDSTTSALPQAEDIELEILRGGKSVLKVNLPWTRKDMLQFMHEQQVAQELRNKQKKKSKDSDDSEDSEHSNARNNARENDRQDRLAHDFTDTWIGYDFFEHYLELANHFKKGGGSRVRLLLTETFKFNAFSPTVSFLNKLRAENKDSEDDERDPFDATTSDVIVDMSKPPFIARVLMRDDGSRYGFIRISSFNIGDAELKDFRTIVKKFNQMKVGGLIVDLLNNGGGSLVHGLAILNALTPTPLKLPTMQVALNDNWINGFRYDSAFGTSDAQRTMASRVLSQLKSDIDAKKRLSQAISSAELAPFVLTTDKSNCVADGLCLKEGVKMVLLVNEMCASMCDIFAAGFRDNDLGPIVGSQTMGAGGNVVTHGISPITQVALTQTESLMVDANGEYLENQGVVPTVAIDTLMDRLNKYSATYKKAQELVK